jgi:hypothetical protein
MSFKKDQEVLIKNPRSLVGVIVRERPGDRDELPENRHYLVRIPDLGNHLKTGHTLSLQNRPTG